MVVLHGSPRLFFAAVGCRRLLAVLALHFIQDGMPLRRMVTCRCGSALVPKARWFRLNQTAVELHFTSADDRDRLRDLNFRATDDGLSPALAQTFAVRLVPRATFVS